MKLGKLFGALITIVVGLALTPTVASAAANLTTSGGAFTSASAAGQLVGLIPLFYVVMIIGGVIGYVAFVKD